MGNLTLTAMLMLSCALCAAALVRWRENLALGLARIQYQIAQCRGIVSLPLWHSPALWRGVIFVIAVLLALLASAALAACFALLLHSPEQTAVAAGGESVLRGGVHPRRAYQTIDGILTLACGVGALGAGVYCVVKRHWMARICHWFWRADTPVNDPYPEKEDPRSTPAPVACAAVALATGLGLLAVGIACCLSGLQKTLPLLP